MTVQPAANSEVTFFAPAPTSSAAQARVDAAMARIAGLCDRIASLRQALASIAEAIAILQAELGALQPPDPSRYQRKEVRTEGKPPNQRRVEVQVLDRAAFDAAMTRYQTRRRMLEDRISAKQAELAQKESELARAEQDLAKAQQELAQAQRELEKALQNDVRALAEAQQRYREAQERAERARQDALIAQAQAQRAQDAIEAGERVVWSATISATDFIELAPRLASFERGVMGADVGLLAQATGSAAAPLTPESVGQMVLAWRAAGFSSEQVMGALERLARGNGNGAVEISTLATESYQDPEINNCLDYACTLLAALADRDVDLSQFRVVILANEDPDQPGHVGLLGSDDTFYDAAGAHDFAAWRAEHPALRVLTNEAGELPRGDAFLAVMSTPAGPERDAALAGAGLEGIASRPLAFPPLLLLGVAALVGVVVLTSCGAQNRIQITDEADLRREMADGDLSNADIRFDIDGIDLPAGVNLTGTHFYGTVTHSEMLAATLDGTVFHQPIARVNFLYGKLTDVTFAAGSAAGPGLSRCNFSFSQLDTATQTNLRATRQVDCIFTGTPLGTEPVLPHVRVNSPAVLQQLTGQTDRAAQIAAIEAMDPDVLFTRLASYMSSQGYDLDRTLLPPAWRGLLNERLLEVAPHSAGNAFNDDQYWTVKPYVFDDIHGHWSNWAPNARAGGFIWNEDAALGPTSRYVDVRPPHGPSLGWFFDYEFDGNATFKDIIHRSLVDMLISDTPTYLDRPWGDAVPTYVAFGVVPQTSGVGLTYPDWRAQVTATSTPVNWNAEDFRVGQILVPPAEFAAVRARLSAADAAVFDTLARDHLVTLEDLSRAGFESALYYLYGQRGGTGGGP